jgi:sugar transport protein
MRLSATCEFSPPLRVSLGRLILTRRFPDLFLRTLSHEIANNNLGLKKKEVKTRQTSGDRIGRKAALVATLLLMGIATVLVGFVPYYSQIGIWGAVLLTILRFIQGVGVGGEWGGSVLLAMEWSKNNETADSLLRGRTH